MFGWSWSSKKSIPVDNPTIEKSVNNLTQTETLGLPITIIQDYENKTYLSKSSQISSECDKCILNSDLYKKYEDYQNQLKRKEDEISVVNREFTIQAKELERKAFEITDLNDEINRIVNNFEDEINHLLSLLDLVPVGNITSKLKTLKDKILEISNYKNDAYNLNLSYNQLNQKYSDLNQNNTDLKSRNQVLEDDISKLNTKIIESLDKISNLTSQVKIYKGKELDIISLSNQINNLQIELSKIREESDEEKRQLNNTINELQCKENKLKEVISAFKKENDSLVDKIENHEFDIQNFNSIIEDLRYEISNLKDEKIEYENLINNVVSERNIYFNEIEDYNFKIRKFDIFINTSLAESPLDDIFNYLSYNLKNLDTLKDENNYLYQKVEELNSEYEKSTKEKDEFEAKIIKLVSEIDEYKKKINDLEERNDLNQRNTTQQRNNQDNKRIIGLEKILKEERDNLLLLNENQKKESDLIIQSLISQRDEIQNDFTSHIFKSVNLERETDYVKSVNSSLEKQINEFIEEKKVYQTERSSLQEKYDEILNKYHNLQSYYTSLEDSYANLHNNYLAVQQMYPTSNQVSDEDDNKMIMMKKKISKMKKVINRYREKDEEYKNKMQEILEKEVMMKEKEKNLEHDKIAFEIEKSEHYDEINLMKETNKQLYHKLLDEENNLKKSQDEQYIVSKSKQILFWQEREKELLAKIDALNKKLNTTYLNPNSIFSINRALRSHIPVPFVPSHTDNYHYSFHNLN